jgi:hypothetical protein
LSFFCHTRAPDKTASPTPVNPRLTTAGLLLPDIRSDLTATVGVISVDPDSTCDDSVGLAATDADKVIDSLGVDVGLPVVFEIGIGLLYNDNVEEGCGLVVGVFEGFWALAGVGVFAGAPEGVGDGIFVGIITDIEIGD